MTTTRRMIIEFDPARETTDGKGWKLTWWDQDNDTPTIVPPNTTENFTRLANSSRLVATISNKALTTNVATLTTSAAHGFLVGQQVVVAGVGAPFDGNWIIASTPSGTTFTYAVTNANVTSVASPGTATVPAFAAGAAAVTNRSLTANVVTITMASHTFRVGDRITVTIGDPVFDGTYVVVSSTTGYLGTITYARTNANVTSAAATGTVITETSLMERMRTLFNAATDVQTYSTAQATATVVAANAVAIAAAAAAFLAAEGVV